MDYEAERRIVPQAVGCMRRSGGKRTYDAELVVGGAHYVVGTGLQTQAKAIERAEVYVDALREEMERVATEYVSRLGLKRAKP